MRDLIVGHVDPAVHGHAMAVGLAERWALTPGTPGALVTYEPGELLEAAYAAAVGTEGLRGPHVWCLATAAFIRRFQPWVGKLDALVVEVPQVYPGDKVDPNDLVQMTGSLGVVIGTLRPRLVLGRYPREWKKNQKKTPHHARIRKGLTPAELERIEDTRTKEDREDLWDAIALQQTRGAFMQLTPPG